MADYQCDKCGLTIKGCIVIFNVCPRCRGFGILNSNCTCKRIKYLNGNESGTLRARSFDCPNHRVRESDWVKIKDFNMSPGKVRHVDFEKKVFFVNFIHEDGGCSEWLEPIPLADIESVITDVEEIAGLEEELFGRPGVYFEEEK